MNEHALTNQTINLLIGTNPNSPSSDTTVGQNRTDLDAKATVRDNPRISDDGATTGVVLEVSTS